MRVKFTHIGIGWDVGGSPGNKSYLTMSCCDKKKDIEILFANPITTKNIDKEVLQTLEEAIVIHEQDKSTFTVIINSNGNDISNNSLINDLKTKLNFKELTDIVNLSLENRIIVKANLLRLPIEVHKRIKKHFRKWLQARVKPDEYDSAVASVMALYFRLGECDAMFPALEISKIDKLRMLSSKYKSKTRKYTYIKKPHIEYLKTIDNFGDMLPGVE